MPRQFLSNLTQTRTIRSLIDEAESAPNIQEHVTPGFDEPRHRLPVVPAVVGTISIDGEHVPAATAAAALGISYDPLEAGSPGKVLTLSHLVALHSRFCQAGGNLVLANDAPQGSTSGTDDMLYTRPERLRLIKPAAFAALADGAAAPVTAYPVTELQVRMGDAANYSAHFEVARRQQKDLPRDLLAFEIAWSIARGIANLVDKVALSAITAAASPFSFAAMAAKDVRADEIRAVVGSSATGFSFNANGQPVVSGIPAELSPAIAGTVAGAFNRGFVVLSDDTRIVLKRNDTQGKMECLVHINMKPGFPDFDYFGTVA